MKRLSAFAVKIAAVAFMGIGALGVSASTASAHDHWHDRGWRHRDDRVIERCDPWGHCRYFRCDWDGDDCYRVGPPAYYGPPRGYSQGYYGPPPPNGVYFGLRVGH